MFVSTSAWSYPYQLKIEGSERQRTCSFSTDHPDHVLTRVRDLRGGGGGGSRFSRGAYLEGGGGGTRKDGAGERKEALERDRGISCGSAPWVVQHMGKDDAAAFFQIFPGGGCSFEPGGMRVCFWGGGLG
jgi:hypothetical protein